MEDQGKRLLLAVGIAFALMLGWQFLFPPEEKPEDGASDEAAETTDGGEAGQPGGDQPGYGATAGEDGAPAATADVAAPVERGEEQLATFEFEKFTATMSSYGGALTSWTLTGTSFEDRSKEGNPPLDLVRTPDEEAWRPFTVWFAESSYGIPDGVEWTPSNQTETTIDYTWRSDALEVVKRFEFVPDDYLVKMTVEVKKRAPGEAKLRLAISTFGYQDPSEDSGGSAFGARLSRAWEAVCYVADGDVRYANVQELAEGPKGTTGAVKWAGFAHSYFLAALSPKNESDERLQCLASGLARDGAMELALLYPEVTIKDGDPTYVRELTAYFGPKFMDRLEEVSALVGYETSFGAAVDLGLLSFICRPLLWLLKTFHGFAGNWGIAIILLTLVVQAITLPWTTKSMRSMKAMAKLRPKMDKIKEKYPDDKQRQQVEMMNLYKAHKINPLAGCLPMILQMPIWFALYRSLSVAAELYQSPFIPGWLDDLTAPDPYYVMPVLLLGMMFMQTKLQPNPIESTQQKIMMYGMPLMFGFFALFFPSGLTLYILTNTILRTGHQHYLNRTEEAKSPSKDAADGDADDDAGAGDKDDEDRAPAAKKDNKAAAQEAPRATKKKSGKKKRSGKGSKKSAKKQGGRAASKA